MFESLGELFTPKRNNYVGKLKLPDLLMELIQEGHWPSNSDEVSQQNLKKVIPKERVEYLIPDETEICLMCPPFSTLHHEVQTGPAEFWNELGALHEVKPELCVTIGDFGLGSDSPIVLDYEHSIESPRVLRLKYAITWVGDKKVVDNHWVEITPNFHQFVEYLSLRSLNFRK